MKFHVRSCATQNKDRAEICVIETCSEETTTPKLALNFLIPLILSILGKVT